MRAAAASLICSIVSLVPMFLHHQDRALRSWIWCRTGFLTSILATVFTVARRLLYRLPFAEHGPGGVPYWRIPIRPPQAVEGHIRQRVSGIAREGFSHWYEFERTATGRGDDQKISYAEAV